MSLSGTRFSFSWRNGLAFIHDLAAAAAAWMLGFAMRFNFDVPPEFQEAMLATVVWIVPLQAVLLFWTGMYRGLWRYASLTDLRRILQATALGALAIASVIVLLRIERIPRTTLILYAILLPMLMGGSRVLYRAWKEGYLSRLSETGEPVIILGAGSAAASLIKSVNRLGRWHIVALLDDDPAKQHREIHGVPVLGKLDDLPKVAKETAARTAVIAMPGQTHGVRRRAMDLCRAAGLEAMTVPAWDDLVSGKVSISQLRKVELDDLLGRDPVKLDNAGLMQWLQGKTVLVTGAGGSIGSELCRQILRFAPAKLVLYELSEFAMYCIEQELGPRHGATQLVYVIGDVKDRGRLEQVFAEHRPSVVFHAAAYKHVPLMEMENAWQAVRNNALGTVRIAQAAIAHGAEKFVLISTDKAVNPASVMGASKRLAELLCQAFSNERTRFVAVRFGNVLGSTGCAIPKFRKQIAAGGAGHGHASRGPPLLHVHSRSHPACAAGRPHGSGRRDFRARHGRAGQDRGPRTRAHPAVRLCRRRDRDRVHGVASRREAVRGTARGRRNHPAHQARESARDAQRNAARLRLGGSHAALVGVEGGL